MEEKALEVGNLEDQLKFKAIENQGVRSGWKG